MEINEEKLENKAIVIANCPIKGYYEYIVSASSTGTKGNDTFFSLYIFNTRSSSDPISKYLNFTIFNRINNKNSYKS